MVLKKRSWFWKKWSWSWKKWSWSWRDRSWSWKNRWFWSCNLVVLLHHWSQPKVLFILHQRLAASLSGRNGEATFPRGPTIRSPLIFHQSAVYS